MSSDLPCNVEADTPFIGQQRNNGSSGMASRGKDIAPQYNPFIKFFKESVRLETFSKWPATAPVKKEDLARDGFIYLNVKDRTQCVFCRGVLSDWDEGDVVRDEHRRHCPECPFAFGYECGNIPLNPPDSSVTYRTIRTVPIQSQNQYQHTFHIVPQSSDTRNIVSGGVVPVSPCIQESNRPDAQGDSDMLPSLPSGQSTGNTTAVTSTPKYPAWAGEQLRLRSFKGWPPQMKQIPRDLASAGLVYLGTGDRCKCYWCGGELYEWEDEDEPWEEHAKWFPTCQHVINMKGQDFIQRVKDKQNGLITEYAPDVFSLPHVLAVLQSGYTRDQVQEVLNRFGSSLVNARDIVEAIEQTKQERQALIERNNMTNRGLDIAPCDDDVVMEEPETLSKPQQATSGAETRVKSVVTPSSSVSSAASQKSEIKRERGVAAKGPESAKGSSKAKGDVDNELLLENMSLKDKTLCKICLDNPLSTAFLPCWHLSTCEECSRVMTHCPICRVEIKEKRKVFWS